MHKMGGRMWGVLLALTMFVLSGFCPTASASPHPVVGVISGAVSNVASALVKWLWSLSVEHTPLKTAVPSRSMVKFESGYTVETVFDGSKLGIGPHSVEVSSSGELLILDSDNSNIYRVSFPLSKYSRPKLIAGSSEGYSGHVDGKPREARMNNPKGLAMDDRGNVYIADAMNMAIRKISDMGITTIAGGKWGRSGGGGHVDGPSEDAKFSDDFDIVYVASSCSLLVVDRGNQAIREIQLHEEDCSGKSYNGNVPFLGIAMLAAAGFFGYMLAVLQQRVKAMFSSPEEIRPPMKKLTQMAAAPYQKLPPRTVRPPLIPPEDEPDVSESGFLSSIGRLVVNTGSSMGEIVQKRASPWPVQESFTIPERDETLPPPLVDSRTPTPKRSYPFAPEEIDRSRHYGQAQHMQRQYQHNEMMQQQSQHQHHHRHHAVNPNTFYESSCKTNEIVFGAVQEHDGRCEAMVIKAVDYSDPRHDHRNNIRSRINYTGYSNGC